MIISHTEECFSFTDDNCRPYPALETAGCGCCKQYLPVTAENIQKAKNDAQKWLEFLEKLKPVEYPPDVTFGDLKK